MPRLQRYVLLELLPPLITGALLFTSIVSFGYFFVSSQWLEGAPLLGVLRYIALQVPDTLVKVFPMAVVLMVVVAYGRLANERELSAVQSGGIGLMRVAKPALIIAALISGLSLFLSQVVVPAANVEARAFYWDELTGAGLTTLAGRTINLGNNVELYFQTYDTGTGQLGNVRVQSWAGEGAGREVTVIFAERGTYEGGTLDLREYRLYGLDYAAIDELEGVPEGDPQALQSALQDVFRATTGSDDPDAPLIVETGLTRKEAIASFADAIAADSTTLTGLLATATDPAATPAERRAALADLSRKLALPFGNLVLVLAALPFALRYGRTTGVALGVALLVAVSYYLTYVLGLSLGNSGVLPAWLGPWVANVTFALAGYLMLRRS